MFRWNPSIEALGNEAPDPSGRSPPRVSRPKRRRASRLLVPRLQESRGWRVSFLSI